MKHYKTPKLNVIALNLLDILATSEPVGEGIKIDVKEKWGDKLKGKE